MGNFGFNADRHDRRQPWISFAARLLIAAGLTVGMVAWLGVVGFVLVVPAWGLFFSGDLIRLVPLAWRVARAGFWRSEQGRFYAFKGAPVRVLEDDLEPLSWLHVQDLAQALGEPIKESGLRLRHARALRDEADGLYVSDDAALAYLATRQAGRALRLSQWIRQEIWYPARYRTTR
ncbi:hypothetical protein BH11PSE10_BH11PSE10_13260 [soil metagenome]